ncbi:hypothetical protein Taro_027736 [Colocasia esculenta]|uniref:Uncharacterized protein n=1 Tax=Colocasia esculenta TaxID=4460 RepID=A0A843VGK4_COLES|nr:hypothetical protein [Colocasia esculenta]
MTAMHAWPAWLSSVLAGHHLEQQQQPAMNDVPTPQHTPSLCAALLPTLLLQMPSLSVPPVWIVATALALITLQCSGSLPVVTDAAPTLPLHGESMHLTTNSRKLKLKIFFAHLSQEKTHVRSTTDTKRDLVSINIEDYSPFDPVPNSKAAVKAGPIEHGTPLMPYVPKPEPPPSHPGYGASP